MTNLNKLLEEFDKKFTCPDYENYCHFNKNDIKQFIKIVYEQGRKDMKEENLIEVEFFDGSKKKVEPQKAIELIRYEIKKLTNSFK